MPNTQLFPSGFGAEGLTPDRLRLRRTRFWITGLTFLAILAQSALLPSLSAADKNGVSPTAISLPKGPGSIEGLGESFQPSLNSGQAQYSVPLKVSPGPGGRAPTLALKYEGGGGDGVLGPGWSLPVASIQRRTDHGLPTYDEPVGFDRADTFINEGREELVPRSDGFFFAKNEGAFVRYEFKSNYWIGTRPDGTRMEFGRTEDAQIKVGSHIFAWLLQSVIDTHGNVEHYTYTTFPGAENRNQKYLRMIEYGAGAPPWKARQFIWFDYEDRPDPFVDGRSGFIVSTGKRLRSISTATEGLVLPQHAPQDLDQNQSTDFLNRRYTLDYLQDASVVPLSSLLIRVRMVGADGLTELPPLEFGYAACRPSDVLDGTPARISSVNEPLFVMDNPLVEFIDLNGDGLPDVLKTDAGGGSHRAYLNQGQGPTPAGRSLRWSEPTEVAAALGAAWNYHLDQSETHLADMDGDGLADLVHRTQTGDTFYFANQGQVGWGLRQALATGDTPPPAPFGEVDVRTGDFDFDKRIDIIQSIDNGAGFDYRIWFNLGAQTYSPPITVPQANGFSFKEAAVQIADLNGDRVPDIARIRPSSVLLTLGLGYGRFDDLQAWTIPDGPLTDEQVQHAKLTDVNGDGLADLVVERAAPGECWYWLNGDHGQFSTHRVIGNLPAFVSPTAAIRWADVNGNGTVDLIYADRDADQKLLGFDLGSLLVCAPAPNLLNAITNGIGRVTWIGYSPSTDFLVQDRDSGNAWPDRMPFPVTVVSAVTNFDSLGHSYVTQFRYHNGYYDSVEKQFRGFARVDQVEIGDSTAPTLVTTFDFDTGRSDESMKGKVMRKRTGLEDGRLFEDMLTLWQVPSKTLFVATDGREVHYAHPVGEVKDVLELGQGLPRRIETESAYDDFGNRTRFAEFGLVENGDRLAGGDERTTVTDYVINTSAWILRLPRRTEIQDGAANVISRSDFFYDDETFSGNNAGEVTRGNLTLERQWKDPQDSTSTISTRRVRYDVYGNPVIELDPLAEAPAGVINRARGHFREMDYDELLRAEVVRERAYAGTDADPLEVTAEYDLGLGTLVSSVDFNGEKSTFQFDPLGRLTALYRPGDQPGFPGMEYEYHLAVPAGTDQWVNYVETRELDQETQAGDADRTSRYRISRQYTDGLGRVLMVRSEAEPRKGETQPRVVVTGAVTFNARQQPSQSLQPFFAVGSKSLNDGIEYASIESPSWSGEFEIDGQREVRNLTQAPKSITEYDAEMRAVMMWNPDGTFRTNRFEPLVTFEYDENDADPSSPHQATPRLKREDGLGRLVEVQEWSRLTDDGQPTGEVQKRSSRYTYDANSQLVSAVDPFGNQRSFSYDGLRRRIQLADPDQGTLRWILDDAANIREIIDGKGQHSVFTYDGLNRRLTERFIDGRVLPSWRAPGGPDAEVIYHYDQPFPGLDLGNHSTGTASHVRGRVAWVEDRSGEEHNSYDARGQLEWVVKRLPMHLQGGSALTSFRTQFRYDVADRISSVVYPDGDQVSYERNARGLIESMSGVALGSLIRDLAYSPAGHANSMVYGNGSATSYAYDLRLRISRITVQPPGGGGYTAGPLLDLSYDFDPASNITGIRDLRTSASVANRNARRNTQWFQYDDLNRIVSARYSTLAAANPDALEDGRIDYRYDAIGNLLEQKASTGLKDAFGSSVDLGQLSYGGTAGRKGRTVRQSSDPAGPHALTRVEKGGSNGTSVEVPYDGNGDVGTQGDMVLFWDFKDRQVAAENSQMRADYLYDYSNRRVAKQVRWKTGPASDGEVVLYVNQYFEVRPGVEAVKYAWLGNNRIARTTSQFNPGTSSRVQWVPMFAGWNLWVSSLEGVWHAGSGSPSVDQAAVWDAKTQIFQMLADGTPLKAGAVLWVHAKETGLWAWLGNLGSADTGIWGLGPDYVPVPNAWSQADALPDGSAVWIFDAERQEWRSWSSGPAGLVFRDDPRPSWWHGQAAMVQWPVTTQWPLADPADAIHFYHADHLGSSTLITDARGSVVQEVAYYPFGQERVSVSKSGAKDPYGYSQKERDPETGLTYFEARYFSTSWARFLRTDPLATTVKADWLSDPQNANPYAYCKNRPMTHVDPDGMDPISLGGGFKLDPLSPSLSFSRGPFSASADTGTAKAAYNFGQYKADLLFNYNLSAGGGFVSKEGGLRFTVDFKSGSFSLNPITPWVNLNFSYNGTAKSFAFGGSSKIDKLGLSFNASTDKSFSTSLSYGAPLMPFAFSDSFGKSIYDAEGASRDLAGLAYRFHGNPIDYYSANKDQIGGDVTKVKTGVENVKKVTGPVNFGAGVQLQGGSSTGWTGILGAQGSF